QLRQVEPEAGGDLAPQPGEGGGHRLSLVLPFPSQIVAEEGEDLRQVLSRRGQVGPGRETPAESASGGGGALDLGAGDGARGRPGGRRPLLLALAFGLPFILPGL